MTTLTKGDILDILGEINTQKKIRLYNILRSKKFDKPPDIKKLKLELNKIISSSEKDENEPRKLTQEEIDYICEPLFNLPSCIEEVSRENNKMLKEKIRDYLKDILLTPLAFDDLREELLSHYIKSLISPGQPVGIAAAMAIGQPTTQANLNTHRQTEKGSISSDLSTFKELLDMTLERKRNFTEGHFKNRLLTREEANILVRNIEETSLKMLVVSSEEYEKVPLEDQWWYNLYMTINGIEFPYKNIEEGEYAFLRLRLNKFILNKFNLTTQEVSKILSAYDVISFPSPTYMGYIDVYKNPFYDLTQMKGGLFPNITFLKDQKLYLNNDILENLSSFVVRGIRGVKEARVVNIELLTKFKQKRYEDEHSIMNKYNKSLDLWEIQIDRRVLEFMGIPKQRFIDFLSMTCTYVDDFDNIVIVEQKNGSPREIISAELQKSKEKIEDFVEKKLKQIEQDETTILEYPSYDELYRLANYTYVFFDGNNIFKHLLKNKYLDKNYLIPKNPNYVFQYFGISATRLFLSAEYNDLLKEMAGSEGINPAHVEILVDFQTALGFPIPVTSSGAGKQGGSAVAAAAFQNPAEAFKKAAGVGMVDYIRGFSGSVVTGKVPRIGSGIVDIKFKKEKKVLDIIREVDADVIEEHPLPSSLMGFNPKNTVPSVIITNIIPPFIRKLLSSLDNGDDFEGLAL